MTPNPSQGVLACDAMVGYGAQRYAAVVAKKIIESEDVAKPARKGGRPRTKAPPGIPNSIGKVREALGMSQEEFASRLKLHPTTISRIETGAIDLGLKRLKQIADVLKLDDPVALLRPVERLRMVRVVGAVQAGVFVESFQWDDDKIYQVAVPDDPALQGIPLAGFEVRGPSMNRVYPEGTVVIIADIFQTREEVTPGKRYVVERVRHDGKREGTVKTYSVDDEGRGWLVPESDQPQFAPIPIAAETDDVESIQALGRVIWSVRRE